MKKVISLVMTVTLLLSVFIFAPDTELEVEAATQALCEECVDGVVDVICAQGHARQ